MNDINPTTGLPMSSGGIDAGGAPYGSSSDDFDNGASESGYDGFNNIADCDWGECLFLDINIAHYLNLFLRFLYRFR